jgi:RecA/RadA recombinase
MAKEKKDDFDKLLEKSGIITAKEFGEKVEALPVLSFGNFAVDLATGKTDPERGNGGLRARDSVEILGKPGQGKTRLANSMIKATMDRYSGRSVIALCSEPPDVPRMEREGIEVDRLLILGASHKDSDHKKLFAENCLDILLEMCQREEVRLIVVDSVATLFTSADAEKTLADAAAMASLAKVYNRFSADFHKKTKLAALVNVNHYREPINTKSFLTPNLLEVDTPGGKTKDFLSMARIRATASPHWEKEGAETVKHSLLHTRKQTGLDCTYTFIRNKYANKDSFRVCKSVLDFSSSSYNNEEITLNYADYFVRVNDKGEKYSLLNPAVIQSGSWYAVGDQKFQGKDKVIDYLRSNPEVVARLQAQIMPYSNEFYSDDNAFSVDEELGD